MRIVYFGSGSFGLPTIESLSREHDLLAVVTQPDRPAGRGRDATPTPIAEWAAERCAGIELIKTESVNEPGVARRVRDLAGDAWVVIAFGQKLSPGLLEGRFAVNLHGSLLPRWRGAAPINHAILGGDNEAGVTVITLADRMDAGLMLGRAGTPIGGAETAGELHDRLAALGPDVVRRVLEEQSRLPGFGAPEFRARGEQQDESLVTKAPKLSRADGWVDFRATADECRRRINSLSPWPGVDVRFRDASLRLCRAEAGAPGSERTGQAAGAVLDAQQGIVACAGGGLLRVLEVQSPGGRPMSWREFANGRRIATGEVLHGGGPCGS